MALWKDVQAKTAMQHSDCDKGYTKTLKLAKKSEYTDLQRELTHIGYNLTVLNENYKHLQEQIK